MKLTNSACQSAIPKDRPYKKFDGGGLYLEIMPSGSKLWRLKYHYLGSEKRISLGPYPLVTLAEARDERDKAKKLLLQNIDPSEAKRDVKRLIVRNAANTFEVIAREWHERQLEKWSAGYAEKIMCSFRMNVFPYIGNRAIGSITPPDFLNDCLRRIEERGALDIARRVKQQCGQVFRYGVATGKCERDPTQDLKGALKTRKETHFRSMEAKDLPKFIMALERNEPRLYPRTRRAIWLSMLTFTRPGEIRQGQWSEINMQEQQWTIPAHKMKMRRDHMVPLSKQAIAILKEQKEEIGHLNTDWIFPSQVRPQICMSDGTVNHAIKRLGYGENMVAHGFRALARTIIREKLKYDSEVIEKQLAHKTKNPLGEAYDRTQFLDERKKMMQDWADYLDGLLKNAVTE